MRNMLIISEAMARAALARKESRGGHARDDFPETDSGHFSKVNVVVRRTATGMQVEEVAHPDPPPEIQQVLEEK
jgi:succinate dehydrogenase / fumarate reductase flavoprotein subunit